MIKKVEVYYRGWGENWLWGTLVSTTIANGRPSILFEYSEKAKEKGYELSKYKLPLATSKGLIGGFPVHQMKLPGPVYDSMPDGWGLLLMDRLFRSRGLDVSKISPLDRLTHIGDNAMGALSFKPVVTDMDENNTDISIEQLATEIREIVSGFGVEFLERIAKVGGSPQGARPKALVYRCLSSGAFSTAQHEGWEPWLIKFPGANEHPESCAVEYVYAECLRICAIETPNTEHFTMNNGLAAFASKRFDRKGDIRIPMQSLAAFTGADYSVPGSIDYSTFLRATEMCTNDVREKKIAYERVVFNVAFNNRDDHPKNVSYIMSARGQWRLSPAFDVTFCNGPGGYHQMDVMGEALSINREKMISLGVNEAEISKEMAGSIIDTICATAKRFTDLANTILPGSITKETLEQIQVKINKNVKLLS